ncbi:MAG: helix-turn-helix transcriptional regulator [Lachnospiraceae bacterium]|nr:helix-turn-helix transcriptional regulator [Lachnospiraceae bacterium]
MTTDFIYTNNLYNLRKANHISQQKMANDLNISRRTIGKIENGEQNLSLEMAYRISAYFNLMVQDVFPVMGETELVRMP